MHCDSLISFNDRRTVAKINQKSVTCIKWKFELFPKIPLQMPNLSHFNNMKMEGVSCIFRNEQYILVFIFCLEANLIPCFYYFYGISLHACNMLCKKASIKIYSHLFPSLSHFLSKNSMLDLVILALFYSSMT